MAMGIIAAVAMFLLLCYIGTLFARLVFVYALERSTTRFCFAVVFALSTFIFVLALLDASRVGGFLFGAHLTTHALRMALLTDLLAIALLCPACLAWSLAHDLRLRRASPQLIAALSLGAAGILCITGAWRPLVAALFRLLWSGVGPFGALWETAATGIALFGVFAVGVLSGFAAVTTPAAFIRPLVSKGSGAEARAALEVLAKRQRFLLSLWVTKEWQLAEFYRRAAAAAAAESSSSSPLPQQRRLWDSSGGPPRLWDWVTNKKSSTSASSAMSINSHAQCQRIEAECEGIHTVSTAVFLQMSEMGSLVRSAENGATWWGVVEAVVGVVLLLHTLLKVIFTVVSLLRWVLSPIGVVTALSPPEDTATRLVTFLETYGLATPHSSGDMAEQRIVWVSLALNAWMIIGSIRGFLLVLFRLIMTYTGFVSVDTTVLGLTMGMGAYFLGQLLLLRLSPALERQSVLAVVLQEHLPRSDAYRHLNDIVFVAACVLTVVVDRCLITPFQATLMKVME